MPRYIDADALMEFVGRERLDTRELIMSLINRMPTADEWKIATEYCMKRYLVMITMDTYEKLIAYYNRGTGL